MFEIIQIERQTESISKDLGRRVLGAFLAVLGVAVLLLFLRALVTEVTDGTFFGLCICLMMLVFGALLTRDGVALASNRRIQLRPWD